MTGIADRRIALAGLLAFAALCLLFWPFVADDAYIVGRYARNAASGHGLVYNPGETISALTSPLHALYITVLAAFSDDPVNLGRALSPLFFLAGWIGAVRIARLSGWRLALLTAAMLGSPFAALWSVGGLETPLLALWLSLYSGLLWRIGWSGTARTGELVALGALCGLAFLTRFDSILVTLPPLLGLAAFWWRRPGVWAGAALALALAGAWLGFAHATYGDILPTSVYVKLGTDADPMGLSVIATLNFLIVSGLALCLVLIRPQGAAAGVQRALLAGCLLSGALFFAYALRSAGVHMMFGNRFFVPYLAPLAFVLLALIRPGGLRPAVAAVLLANTGAAAWVQERGMNPSPVRLAHLNEPELAMTTPSEYGRMIATLQEAAAQIRSDLETRDPPPERPSIFLYTGGMGYFLPEFYVYETLVSYRHDCPVTIVGQLHSAHYVQQFSVEPINDFLEAVTARRTDLDRVPVTEAMVSFEGPNYVRYLYGAAPREMVLPGMLHGACRLPIVDPALQPFLRVDVPPPEQEPRG